MTDKSINPNPVPDDEAEDVAGMTFSTTFSFRKLTKFTIPVELKWVFYV